MLSSRSIALHPWPCPPLCAPSSLAAGPAVPSRVLMLRRRLSRTLADRMLSAAAAVRGGSNRGCGGGGAAWPAWNAAEDDDDVTVRGGDSEPKRSGTGGTGGISAEPSGSGEAAPAAGAPRR